MVTASNEGRIVKAAVADPAEADPEMLRKKAAAVPLPE